MKVRTPGAFVLRGGRLYPIPRPSVLGLPTTWRGVARYSLLPVPARLRLALEPLVWKRKAADESVGSFFRRRFGSRTVDLIAQPLLGGIHVFVSGYEDFELRVIDRTPDGFRVEAKNTESTGRFSWRVVAKRKDIAGPRLEPVTIPSEPTMPSVPDISTPAPLPDPARLRRRH